MCGRNWHWGGIWSSSALSLSSPVATWPLDIDTHQSASLVPVASVVKLELAMWLEFPLAAVCWDVRVGRGSSFKCSPPG